MTVLVEYLVRLRLVEPSTVLSSGQVGETLHALLGEIGAVAVEQEIISRDVLAGPDQPSRIRCAARSLDPTRHYATSTRYRLNTSNDETLTFCSAACGLSWFCCEGLAADVQEQHQNGAEAASSGPGSEVAA
jgi:hypothetical protein